MTTRHLLIAGAALAALALSACASTTDDQALKFSAVGINASVKTGVTGGSISATSIQAPKVSKDGKTLYIVTGPCGWTDTPDVASNLNSNANASASGASQTGAFASGDQFFTGHAARYVGLGGGQAPSSAAITAAQTCTAAH